VATGLANGAGGVFPACGTGEFHALTVDESAAMTRIAVEEAAGSVPVISGAGGPLPHAVELARRAAEAGADGLLLLPPYLVGGPADGLERYVDAVASASPLPLIVYNRGTAQYS